MDVKSLILSKKAYKIFSADKKSGMLSHAYLIVCDDEMILNESVKIFAKTLFCNCEPNCDSCRICRIIDSNSAEDVMVYPKEQKFSVADADDIVKKSHLKPLECDKKAFVILNAQDMNAVCQNKLLKTLEEPPENTYILIGATSTNQLLSTLKSRVKQLEISKFNNEQIFDTLCNQLGDLDRLKKAIRLSGGRVGETIERYNSDSDFVGESLALSVLKELKSSRDVMSFSSRITKENLSDFLSSLGRIVGEVLRAKAGNSKGDDQEILALTQKYSYGALLYIIKILSKYEKSKYFNGNIKSIADGVLFGILEGKHKWSE